jgi:regulatory protein
LKKPDNNSYSKKEAISTLTKLCSKKEICSFEAEEKLNHWGIQTTDKKEIIDFLIREKFIDDLRFSVHFASDKFRFNKWGKYKIANALKFKRIPETVIKKALDELPDENYKAQLQNELVKKIRSMPKSSDYEMKGKLYRFAAGRGYENNLIMDVLNEIFQ